MWIPLLVALQLLTATYYCLAKGQSVDSFRYANPLLMAVDDQGKIINGIVTSAIEADNGVFWFGTQDGLVSYDGYVFKRFPHRLNNANSPAANYIVALAQDQYGDIWLATRTSGLTRYSPKLHQFTHFNTTSEKLKLRTNTLRTLAFDSHGRLWLGHELGVDEVNIEAMTITYHDLPVNKSINYFFYEDFDGSFWVGSTKGVFIRHAKDQNFQAIKALENIDVRSIYRSDNGVYWLGGRRGLKLWRGAGNPYQLEGHGNDIFNQTYVRSIVPRGDDKLWVASYGKGLALFDIKAETLVKNLRHDPSDNTSLVFDDVGVVMLAKNDTLVIGTWGGGLQLMNSANSRHFVSMRHSLQHDNSLSFSNVRAILELQSGELLVGTTGNGIDVISPQLGRQNTINKTENNEKITDLVVLIQQVDGTIWAGSATRGLFQVNMQTGQLIQPEIINLNQPVVLRLLELSNQTLVIGTNKGACLLKVNDNVCQFLSLANGNRLVDVIRTLIEDKDNNLWIGTLNGLYRLRKGGVIVEHFSEKDSLSHNYVMGGISNPDGNLWLRTNLGFDTVSRLSHDSPLIEPATTTGLIPGANMLLDSQQRVWSATHVIDIKQNLKHKLNKTAGVDIGTPWLGAYTQLRSGLMIFGGTDGLLIVDPENYPPQIQSTPLTITRVKINGKETTLSRLNQFELAPEEHSFSIQLSAPDVIRAKEISYQYRLIDHDEEWLPLDTIAREIHFNNLQPNDYTLSVKASYLNLPIEIAELSLRFTVTPEFWQTWWFRTAAFFVAIAILIIVFRWRIGIVKAKAMQLEVLVEQRTREIQVINQIGQQFTLQLQLEDLLNEIYQRLSEIFVADRFGIGIYNEQQNQLDFNYAIERGVRYQPYARKMDEAGQLAVYAVEHNRSVLIADYDKEYQQYYDIEDSAEHALISGQPEFKVQAMMYVPMQHEGTMLGVISIQSVDINSYNKHDLTLLESLASYASIALSNAKTHENLVALHQTLQLRMDELKQTQQQLILNEKMAYLGQLVAGVAHEINTPIGVTITASSVVSHLTNALQQNFEINQLSRKNLSQYFEKANDSLTLIQKNAQKAAELVQKFKRMAVESGNEVSTIWVCDFCNDVLKSLPEYSKKRLTSVDILIDKCEEITSNSVVLAQVLYIILQNACLHAFNQNKGNITITSKVDETTYTLSIKDNGCGMEQAQIARIFEPFYTTGRMKGDTGLGLSIAFNLVHQSLKGEISCQSLIGQGSTFSIRLPVKLNKD